MHPIEDTILEHRGHQFAVEVHADLDHGAPWDEYDGHGIVSEWTSRDKAPGERILCADYSRRRYYDVVGTLAIAKRDGWGTADGQRDGESKAQYAQRAVNTDYEYLRAWCNDEWQYVGVSVRLLPLGPERSLWGCESLNDYPAQVARELADELLAEQQDALQVAFGKEEPTEEDAQNAILGWPDTAPRLQVFSLTELRNGTGFPRGARFVMLPQLAEHVKDGGTR